jgi:hypothetical protein
MTSMPIGQIKPASLRATIAVSLNQHSLLDQSKQKGKISHPLLDDGFASLCSRKEFKNILLDLQD